MVDLLTAQDVARMLKCSRAAVYRLHQRGQLIARWKLFDGERGWRWSLPDVEVYLVAHSVVSSTVNLPEKVVRDIVFTPSVDASAGPYIPTRKRRENSVDFDR